MGIKKEWECMAHGYFESDIPKCPAGCDTVQRVFLTPQSVNIGGRKHFVDDTLQKIADDYGFSDMSNRNGDSVVHNAVRNNPQSFAPIWKAMPKDGAQAAQVLKESGVTGDMGGGALGQGQFRAPKAVVDDRMKFGDARMLQASLAEGQKANQP